jgi:hypothetical protein
MITMPYYNYLSSYLKCWEEMKCPNEKRKKCWAYRLNLGLECWIIRKKALNKSNWQKQKKCSNCKFYIMICQKFNIE